MCHNVLPDKELVFLRIGQQSVTGVQSNLVTYRTDHSSDLALEIGRVINDIEVGMSYPGRCGFAI